MADDKFDFEEEKLPCEIVATTSYCDGEWDGIILVAENLNWDVPALNPIKVPIQKAAQVDNSVLTDVGLYLTEECAAKWVVYAPTGPVNRDYDDVRRYYDAAEAGMKRALKAGSKKPVLMIPPSACSSFPNAWSVTVLGALHALYVPIEIREDCPDRKQKATKLGIWCDSVDSDSCIHKAIKMISALESGRVVARDIGGSDPERMAAPLVFDYVKQLFPGTKQAGPASRVVNMWCDHDQLKKEFPILSAVNRAAYEVERHRARVIELEYVGEGEINTTLLLVGKGITYDTGGLDIKAGGVMAGMHRDKCGAAAVAGFFQILNKLKPKGIKVKGVMAMVRNSVGPDGYVADEIITSRAKTRVRVGNTDAEGRMAMADPLCYMKEKALNEINPHLMTIATLTGHAIIAMSEAYSIVMDNGPAQKESFAQALQAAGNLMADPFEISTIRREDYNFIKGRSEYEDVLQCNNQPSSRTPRGHQFPAAFMIRASGLDKHGKDSEKPLCYTHVDIAGSAGPFPGIPTGAPVLAMAQHFLTGRY